MVHIPPHVLHDLLSCAALLKLALAKKFDLNLLQFLTLMLVGRADRLLIRELRDKLSIAGSSLTFTIDSLENKRLIKRQRSKEDRRQWFLSLTAKGRQQYGQILGAQSAAISPAIEKLSETEKATLLELAEETTQTEPAKLVGEGV